MKKFIRSISERATRPSLNIDHLGRMKRKKKKSVTCSVLLHGVESAKQFLSSPQHGQASEHPPFSSTLHTQGLTFFKMVFYCGRRAQMAGVSRHLLHHFTAKLAWSKIKTPGAK